MIQIDPVSVFGWLNCLRLSNGFIELVVTTDVGPRVVWCGFSGGHNHFAEFPADHGQTGGDTFRMYGGHRFWLAPEAVPRSYYPDNQPVEALQREGVLRLIAPIERTTGLQKEIDLALSPDTAQVTVTHRLRNHNLWAVEVAAWGLSVMAPGGVAVIPLPPRAPHSDRTLLPTSHLVLWSYTDLADPRWQFGTRYILLRQDPPLTNFQKLGVFASDGWAAYARGGEMFVKTFEVNQAAVYPDRNSPFTAFVCAEFLELETMGPLTHLRSGAVLEHEERWHLLRDVPVPHSEADVVTAIAPRVGGLSKA
jgi:hypothetical protein